VTAHGLTSISVRYTPTTHTTTSRESVDVVCEWDNEDVKLYTVFVCVSQPRVSVSVGDENVICVLPLEEVCVCVCVCVCVKKLKCLINV